MSRKIFRELVSIEEAEKRLREHFEPRTVGVEKVPLSASYGRVLAEEVTAPIDVPPFDRSAMDGYAVHAEDTYGADEEKPLDLRVIGSIEAGEKPEIVVGRGEAAEISTGAPIPRGANAVVMVEYALLEGDKLKVFRSVSSGENITPAGSDIMAGELVLRSGTALTPRESGVLAALGSKEVEVFRKPRVAVVSTGKELVMPGEALPFGKIYDINSQTVSDSVRECGGEPVFIGIAEDDMKTIRERIEQAMEMADVIVISGGTSAGVGDLLYRVINDLGRPGILVHGVAARPGKPTIIAVTDGKPIFSLPGYPTSALMMFNIFVAPVLRSMAGLDPKLEMKTISAKTSSKIYTGGGRREYIPVNLVKTEDGKFRIYPVPGGSGAITSLEKADGFTEVPENRTFLEEDETVEVKLFSSQIRPADLMLIGSHCLGVEVILGFVRLKVPSFLHKIINVGSSGGLTAIRRGEADIAGVHLLDEATENYNLPFLKEYGIDDKAILVRGYIRKQGLIVSRGNPKRIVRFEDLLRDDITFMNRNRGSGTRILTDVKLKLTSRKMGKRLEELTAKINGYDVEARSHSAIAAAVAFGKADAGVVIRAVADRYGLDFIPIADEQYDFVVNGERIKKPVVRAFLETLKSEEFKKKLAREVSGLIPTEETGKTIYVPQGMKHTLVSEYGWILA